MKKIIFCLVAFFVMSGAYLYAGEEEARFNEAVELINEGEYKKAVIILEELYTKNNTSVEIRFNTGVAYLYLGNYEFAELCFTDVISKDPQYLPARFYMGLIYEKQKRFAEALAEWNTVVELAEKEDIRELAKKHILQLKTLTITDKEESGSVNENR